MEDEGDWERMRVDGMFPPDVIAWVNARTGKRNKTKVTLIRELIEAEMSREAPKTNKM